MSTAEGPVLGRPSPASSTRAPLRVPGGAGSAAYRAEGGRHGRWEVRAASAAGVRHRLAGAHVEDAWAWAAAGDTVIGVVADGIGSRDGSAATAAAAADAAARAPLDLPDGTDPEGICRTAVAAANEAAAATPPGATTVVVAAVGPEGCGAVARVGDSTAWRLVGGTWEELFTAGGDDGLVTPATPALPAEDPEVEVHRFTLGHGEALILVTDGVGDPLRDGPTTVAPAFAEALREPPTPLALAALVDFQRQGCFDDRTLLGLWAAPEGDILEP